MRQKTDRRGQPGPTLRFTANRSERKGSRTALYAGPAGMMARPAGGSRDGASSAGPSPVAGWTTGPGYGMRERNTPLAETGLKMTGADVSREMIRGRSENRTG